MRLSDIVSAVFATDGALARVVEGYEAREGQRTMAAAVADVIEDGGTLLAEAGTGTGKTLAYLIPAILSRQRVLVSTGTKNLQEQLFSKDLPALQKALDIPFTATVMKGRTNYLCLHRYEMYRDGVEGNTSAGGRLIETGDRVLLPIVDAWAKKTETGDRAELRDLPEDLALWKDIAADAETCLGQECPRYSECFVTKMRQRAAESDVVIVNHHLLCADASVRHNSFGEVIPACPTLVVDEAHQLEDVATHYFGVVVSSFRIDDLVRDGMHLVSSTAFVGATHASPPQAKEDIVRALTRVERHGRAFFTSLVGVARYTAESMSEGFEDGMMLIGSLEALEASLALNGRTGTRPAPTAGGDAVGPDIDDDAAAIQRRAGEVATQLRFLLRASDPDFVFYLETRGRGMFLCASPIDVSRVVQEAIFDRARASILTSATLAVDGSFEYVRGRLGIRQAVEVRVASEFDYATQAILYLPRRMPAPKHPSFAEAAAREVMDVLTRTEGRAFVLFTSYAVLHSVQQFLQMSLRYPLLVQGTAPRSTLIEQFRMTPNAVLLATSSFWQGVDVVGDALSCVIVDKLPFASPGDPVTAARMESIAARGGDAFADYQVPLAILALQQGLGRLIRHRTDRGVLAILDPRLRTMGYGRRFMNSLPPAPITMDAAEISRFLAGPEQGRRAGRPAAGIM